MRTIEYGTPTHVPAFLTKLWKLVTDVSCDELISWSPAGTSFIIFDEIRFSKELLPMYFKHNNMASFVRQLNMYGFRKLSCIDQGGMHCYKSEIEFYHQYFLKGQESLLELIKRKIPNSKSEEPKVKQEYVDELMNNIKSLKGKQDSAEQGMRYLKRENKMLWRHIGLLAEQYSKQQNVLQQLVPFFMNMVQSSSSRDLALKRKAPLMIDEGSAQPKLPRLSSSYYVEHSDQDQIGSMPTTPGNVTNRGPVIHDITEMESNKMFPANLLCSPNTSTKESEAIVDSPLSCSLESSEQSSPYTESAVETTLNILNHNFERSNSLSPHLEVKHSPLHHNPSNINAMPSPQTPRSSYSGISPVTIIDETTSDVPMSSTMMPSSFVPKMEDTCSNSGMYSMDGMLRKRVSMMPEILTERSASGFPEQSTSRLPERLATLLPEQLATILQKQTVTLLGEQSSSMIPKQTATILQDQPPSMLPEKSVTILQEQSPSMLQEQSANLFQVQSPSMLLEQPTTLLQERSPAILSEQSATLLQERSPSMLSDQSATFLRKRSNSMLSQQSATFFRQRSPSTVSEQSATMLRERLPSILSDQSATLLAEQSPSLLQDVSILIKPGASILPIRSRSVQPDQTTSILSQQTSSLLPEEPSMLPNRTAAVKTSSILPERSFSASGENPSTSSQNKFLPNYQSLSKSIAANMPWLINQEPEGTQANIDNWLGQIFKSDNLVPGLSLPHEGENFMKTE